MTTKNTTQNAARDAGQTPDKQNDAIRAQVDAELPRPRGGFENEEDEIKWKAAQEKRFLELAAGQKIWIRCDTLNRGAWGYDPDPQPDNAPSFDWPHGFGFVAGEKKEIHDHLTHTTMMVEIVSADQRNGDMIGSAKII